MNELRLYVKVKMRKTTTTRGWLRGGVVALHFLFVSVLQRLLKYRFYYRWPVVSSDQGWERMGWKRIVFFSNTPRLTTTLRCRVSRSHAILHSFRTTQISSDYATPSSPTNNGTTLAQQCSNKDVSSSLTTCCVARETSGVVVSSEDKGTTTKQPPVMTDTIISSVKK